MNQKITKVVVVLLMIVLIATPIAAQAGTIIINNAEIVESFEEGNLGADWTGDTSNFQVTTEKSYEGSYSLKDNSDTTTFDSITLDMTEAEYTSTGYAFYYDEPSVQRDQRPLWEFENANGDSVTYVAVETGNSVVSGSDSNSIIYHDGSNFVDTGYNLPMQQWVVFSYEDYNYTSQTVDMYVYYANGTEVGNTTNMQLRNGGEISSFNYLVYEQSTTYLDYIVVNGSTQVEPTDTTDRSLELEIDKWMPFNSTQDYTVYLNETNTTTGETTLKDVTANANLTSSEPNIVAVNNSSDQLESFGVTGVSEINASYTNDSNTYQSSVTNVTVGNRNLTNIGIMPPSQYINSFLGIDETAGEYGIGSGTQWLIFVIIVAATFGKTFENDWVGLGLGLLTAIMLWVVEFIGLGMVLTITFFVIFVGTLKMRVHNRGSNGGETNVYVESRDFNK